MTAPTSRTRASPTTQRHARPDAERSGEGRTGAAGGEVVAVVNAGIRLLGLLGLVEVDGRGRVTW